jgi:hypothetical protein
LTFVPLAGPLAAQAVNNAAKKIADNTSIDFFMMRLLL